MSTAVIRSVRNWFESYPDLDDARSFRNQIKIVEEDLEKERQLLGYYELAEANIADGEELLKQLRARLEAILTIKPKKKTRHDQTQRLQL